MRIQKLFRLGKQGAPDAMLTEDDPPYPNRGNPTNTQKQPVSKWQARNYRAELWT